MSPRLCLNMIVKNESRVIRRLLESVYKYIDSYCICDTGSTDDTEAIITKFFQERCIPGRIVHEPFRDFGHNRSFALKACEEDEAEYILLLDADMKLKIRQDMSPDRFKAALTADAYHIYQGTDHFYYKNTRIVRNHRGYSYWGVTHEYVNTPDGTTYAHINKDDVFIEDIGDGGCKADKFQRDIRLLKKGLEEIPGNDRYTFYLANSYRDAGEKENAIEAYKARAKLGGWVEEIWQSYYNIGKCYRDLGDMERAIYYWMEAYHCFPERIENLFEIVTHYRNQGKNILAYAFYEMARRELDKKRNLDYLFMQKDIYDFKMDYEFTILGYYCNPGGYDIPETCMKVMSSPHVEDWIIKNVMSNYKFYTKAVTDTASASALSESNRALLAKIGSVVIPGVANPDDFVASTPTLAYDVDGKLVVIVRYVNYRVTDDGGYSQKAHITTHNVCARFDVTDPENWAPLGDEFLLKYSTEEDGYYEGLEDVRVCLGSDGRLYYNANRGLLCGDMAVEHGVIDWEGQTTVDSRIIKIAGQGRTEKNWVMVPGTDKMIYGWSPLRVGTVDGSKFETTHTIATPPFFAHLRGSTNGVMIRGELWFLCHWVSYEDRRYYYHIFVVLDPTTYAVKRYTRFFTFEKAKVEYSLGFIYRESTDDLLIGYSVLDRETKYVVVSREQV